MKKLEDIPKESVFKVPDGYFDRLPGVVQSRVAQKASKPALTWTFAVRYALPAVILVAAGLYFFSPSTDDSIEGELAMISADQIEFYLEDNVHDDEIHDESEFSAEEVDQLEQDVYSEMSDLSNEINDALELENL